MNLSAILNSDVCVRMMLTLGHFLWQATAIALAALGIAWMLRRSSANARYLVLLAALLAMAACPPVTFLVVGGPAELVADTAPPAPETASEVAPPTLAGAEAPARAGMAPAIAEAAPGQADIAVGIDLPPAAAATTPEPSTSSAPPSQFWAGWQKLAPHLTLAYLVGVGLMLLRLLVGLHGGGRLRQTSQPIADGDLLATLSRQARRIGLRLTPAAAWCQHVATPTVVGIFRPVILLPAALVSGLTVEQIEGILLHELAHIRRHDYLVNLVQRVIEAYLFFHPAVWWVSRRIRVEREHCCDDVAVAVGGRPASYAAMLLDLAEKSLALPARQRGHLVALGATDRPGGLRLRVHRLMGVSSHEGLRLRRSWPLVLVAVVTVGLAIVLGCLGDKVPAEAPLAGPAEVFSRAPEIRLYDDDNQKTGLYAIGPYDRLRFWPFNTLYESAASGKMAPGHDELVGRMAGTYSDTDKFEVTESVRDGNQIKVHIRYIRGGPQEKRGGAGPATKRAYVWAPLRQNLPDGRYSVVVELVEYLPKDGQLIAAPLTAPRAYERLTCNFDVPTVAATQPAAAWGEVANDLQAGLDCKEVLGDPAAGAVLTFRLKNTGDKPIRILKLAEQKRSWGDNLPVVVKVGAKVLAYRGPVLAPPPAPSASAYIYLAPGETDSVDATFVAKHWRLDDPQKAEITFVFRSLSPTNIAGPYDQVAKAWVTINGLWTGEARSNMIMPGRPAAGATVANVKSGEEPVADGDKTPWGEAVEGLQMRLTAPQGTEFRRATGLPLTIEVRNAGDQVLEYQPWSLTPQIEIRGSQGEAVWSVPSDRRPMPDLEGRLAPGQVLKWTVGLERMPFARSWKAGDTLQLNLRQGVSRPSDDPQKDGPLPRLRAFVFASPLKVKLADDFPAALKAGEIPEKWSPAMTLIYHERGMWWGSTWLQVDGQGRALLMRSRGGHPDKEIAPGVYQTRLSREQLDALAALLKAHEFKERREMPPIDDLGQTILVLSVGGAAAFSEFREPAEKREPALAALRTEMRKLLLAVATAPAAAIPDESPVEKQERQKKEAPIIVDLPDGRQAVITPREGVIAEHFHNNADYFNRKVRGLVASALEDDLRNIAVGVRREVVYRLGKLATIEYRGRATRADPRPLIRQLERAESALASDLVYKHLPKGTAQAQVEAALGKGRRSGGVHYPLGEEGRIEVIFQKSGMDAAVIVLTRNPRDNLGPWPVSWDQRYKAEVDAYLMTRRVVAAFLRKVQPGIAPEGIEKAMASALAAAKIEESSLTTAIGLEVTIEPQQKKYVLGQPMPVKWTIRNIGTTDQAIIWHDRFFCPVFFEITDKDGKTISLSPAAVSFRGTDLTQPRRIVLHSGESKSESFDLSKLLDKTPVGMYRLVGLYTPQQSNLPKDYLTRPELTDVVAARIDSAAVEVEIVAGELPGSQVPLEKALSEKGRLIVLCQALEDGIGVNNEEGVEDVIQKYKVVQVLAGESAVKEASIHYTRLSTPSGGERRIMKGDQVIWIVRPTDKADPWYAADHWGGLKALADAPENRRALGVAPAAGALPVDKLLPGSRIKDLRPYLWGGEVFALMEATEEPRPETLEGTLRLVAGQEFKVIAFLGDNKIDQPARVAYTYDSAVEAPVAKGQRVLWLAGNSIGVGEPLGKVVQWGIKAYPDTPQNRTAALPEIRAALADGAAGRVIKRPEQKAIVLPGSRVPLGKALEVKGAVVALCQAIEGGSGDSGADGEWSYTQKFKVMQVLTGGAAAKEVAMSYTLITLTPDYPGSERAITEGETVLWIAQPTDKADPWYAADHWRGIKALADTPENRQALGVAPPVPPEQADARHMVDELVKKEMSLKAWLSLAAGQELKTRRQLLNEVRDLESRGQFGREVGSGQVAQQVYLHFLGTDPADTMRSAAANFLRPDSRQAAEALTGALSDDSAIVRVFAAQSLGKAEPTSAVDLAAIKAALLKTVDDEDLSAARSAVGSLGRLKHGPAIAQIVRFHKDHPTDEEVACTCAEALAGLGEQEVVFEAAHVALGSKNWNIRYFAIEALRQVASPKVVPFLVAHLSGELELAHSELSERRVDPRGLLAMVQVLRERTGQPFGADVNRWVEWLEANAEKYPQQPPGGKPQRVAQKLQDNFYDAWEKVDNPEWTKAVAIILKQAGNPTVENLHVLTGAIAVLKARGSLAPPRQTAECRQCVSALKDLLAKRDKWVVGANPPTGMWPPDELLERAIRDAVSYLDALTEWGATVNGLRARLVCEQTRFVVGQPVPARLEIECVEGYVEGYAGYHQRSQLFPHVDVWWDAGPDWGKRPLRGVTVKLPIENRLIIRQGETFKHEFDLAKVLSIKAPDRYRVMAGHDNAGSKDIGDWTGDVRSEAIQFDVLADRPENRQILGVAPAAARPAVPVVSVTVKLPGDGKVAFGESVEATIVLKNISDTAIVVQALEPVDSRSGLHVPLAGPVYGELQREGNAYEYNPMSQQPTRVPFYAGFLLPGEEVGVRHALRPLCRTERFVLKYMSAAQKYDGTAASLSPLNVYVPLNAAATGRTTYGAFDAEQWVKVVRANPEVGRASPHADARSVLLPDTRAALLSQAAEFPVAFKGAAFPMEDAEARAAKIAGGEPAKVQLAYSAALGGYAVTVGPQSWLLSSAAQKEPGRLLPVVPAQFLGDVDSMKNALVLVGDKQDAKAAPSVRPAGWKLWDTYPVHYGDGMYTRGEFIDIDKSTLADFLQNLLDKKATLKPVNYFFSSRYYALESPPAGGPDQRGPAAQVPGESVPTTPPPASSAKSVVPAEAKPAALAAGVDTTPWGQAVEGVQVRLRVEKLQWKAGEAPVLLLDVVNRGTQSTNIGRLADQNCCVEVDGQRYGWAEPIRMAEFLAAPGEVLKAGSQTEKPLEVVLDSQWGLITKIKSPTELSFPEPGASRLQFTPGRHKVRVLFKGTQYVDPTVNTPMVRIPMVASKEVVIDILPADAQTAAAQEQRPREVPLGELSGMARDMAGAMPAGWKLVGSGRCGAPHRWSGRTDCEYLSFKHDTLEAVFPPGPAAFSMWLTSASYAGRRYESAMGQPGGASLYGASDTKLMFLEGGLPEEGQPAGRAPPSLEKIWLDQFGLRQPADHGLSPAAQKTFASPPRQAPDAQLPGSTLSVAEAMKVEGFRFAAICKAETDAAAFLDNDGLMQAAQSFKAVVILAGDGRTDMAEPYNYCYVDTPSRRERAVTKGEQVIWIVRRDNLDQRAVKALADTPENRKALGVDPTEAKPAAGPTLENVKSGERPAVKLTPEQKK